MRCPPKCPEAEELLNVLGDIPVDVDGLPVRALDLLWKGLLMHSLPARFFLLLQISVNSLIYQRAEGDETRWFNDNKMVQFI